MQDKVSTQVYPYVYRLRNTPQSPDYASVCVSAYGIKVGGGGVLGWECKFVCEKVLYTTVKKLVYLSLPPLKSKK